MLVDELVAAGLPADVAAAVAARALDESVPADVAWSRLTRDLLRPEQPFAAHLLVYRALAARWDERHNGPLPAWRPDDETLARAHVTALGAACGCADYRELHAWSVAERAAFWEAAIAELGIALRTPPRAILDLARGGAEDPDWLLGARLNVAESCFAGPPTRAAIVFRRDAPEGAPTPPLETTTLAALRALSGRVANGLRALGVAPGTAVAVDLPMSPEAVAIYLGIVRAGAAVVSIADSFAPHEIATRLRIGGASLVFTQDELVRGGKRLPLLAKVIEAGAARCVVLPGTGDAPAGLRPQDLAWSAFLAGEEAFEDHVAAPDEVTNILFSSGTTGDPKAIPWTHLTPIKCAADARYHHDVHEGDVLAWPTNLGWMMGPWLIYAALVNGATIALHGGAPQTRAFGEFVRDAGVTMLGVVPSLVATWRASGCLEGLDWSAIRCFSSTGECSNPEDMLWLMSRAGYRPVIEYCGGTEIGGGYLTGTLVQPAAPAAFTTAALGLTFELRDEAGHAAEDGEVFLLPPSIGLSQRLLNRDHHEVYYADAPRGPDDAPLRRHGDQISALPGGFYQAHGRVDDTMNLGGIKVGSAEIERVVGGASGVHQAAAIAVPAPGGGPSRLVVYVEPAPGTSLDPAALQTDMQRRIKQELNPLFKVHEVRLLERLPRTASNKVMRRELRAAYLAERA